MGQSVPKKALPFTFLQRFVNPLYVAVLRSPLHGVLSSKVLPLRFHGRKTGRAIEIPVGYGQQEDTLYVATRARWQVNFRSPREVSLWLRGQPYTAHAVILTEPTALRNGYTTLITHRPLLGRLTKVRLDSQHQAMQEDIEAAQQQRWALLRVDLEKKLHA